MACGHKEAAAHPPAEAQVGASLREADAADQAPLRVVDDDSVELLTSHPHPHQRLPSISHRTPSGVPGPALMKTRRFSTLPPSSTSSIRPSRFGVARASTK